MHPESGRDDEMRYLLLIYAEPPQAEPDPAQVQEEMGRYYAFTKEAIDRGFYKGGEALEQSNTATTVRVRNGQTLTTDGPFAETREELGGYYLLDCPDLDAAIEMAAKIPTAERGSIEIRPIWEVPNMAVEETGAAAGTAG
jgi:hypothetical protein